MNKDRDIIQFLPRCALYDDELFYKLREGSCVIKSREFKTQYDINKNGLRDDEESLKGPKIIVLGDSHAMGWGISQNKTFPSLLEKSSNLKTLNAAISSYGTAREFLMLKRLDKSNLKYLIIQYCSNDGGENHSFVENNYKLKNTNKEIYQRIVQEHVSRTIYNPLNFIGSIAEDIRKSPKKKQSKKIDELSDDEINNMLKIIKRITKIINKDVKIILLEVNRSNSNRKHFANRTSKTLKKGYPKLQNRITILDSSKILRKKDYFILDDHMTEEGHEKLANEILKLLKEIG